MSLPPRPRTSSARAARSGRLLPLLALLLLGASGRIAAAATLNVPANYPTIQAAVTAAASGDTVVVADGTYSGVGNRDIDFGGKSLTVQSASGDPARTTIDCGGSASSNHRGFTLSSDERGAVVSGFTVKNGYESTGGGGGISSYGTVTHCTIIGNFSGGNGGGAIIFYPGTLTDCTISGNTAGGSGGGVYEDGGTLTSCTISGNSAGGTGGGVSVPSGTLTNCTITGNTASGSGGGVISLGAVTGCVIRGNTAGGTGGGIYDGGGIYNRSTLTNCAISGNTAVSDGGGVFASNANLTYCTITGNTTGGSGGGVFAADGGAYLGYFKYNFNSCIIYGNSGGEVIAARDPIVCYSCDVQGGYPGTGNINADPLFVNAAGGDLHLKPTSPCVGTGTAADFITTDLDGHTRPNPPSIGAYDVPVRTRTGHTHLLWNNVDGRVMLWSVYTYGTFSGDFLPHGFGPYTDGAPQNKWTATAIATGADGKSHLLWNNTDGRVMLWTVDDAGNFTYTGYGPYTDDSVGNDPSVNKWSATAVSVGPDNTVHLLWNNTDHRVMLWNVQPDFSFTLAGYGPYTDDYVSRDPGNLWSATALATGPDNVSRIAWNNADGRVMLWNVDSSFNFTLAGYGPYTDGAPQNKWSAVGVSVGPDYVTHLLWSNTDRRAMFWNVSSDFSFTLAGYGPYTDDAPQNLWTATSLATGPDNLSHILWDNTDYRAMLWGVGSAFGFTVAGYGPYTDTSVSLDPGNLWTATAVSAGP